MLLLYNAIVKWGDSQPYFTDRNLRHGSEKAAACTQGLRRATPACALFCGRWCCFLLGPAGSLGWDWDGSSCSSDRGCEKGGRLWAAVKMEHLHTWKTTELKGDLPGSSPHPIPM